MGSLNEMGTGYDRHPREYWWKGDNNDCHRQIFAACDQLRQAQEYRRAAYIHYLRLYSNRIARDMTGEKFASAVEGGDKIRLNVVKSAIDTAVATIATDRAAPKYLSVGGNYFTRKRAEKQSQWALGALLHTKHYTLSHDIFRDGAIFGCGIEFPDYHEDQLFIRRVFPDELIIDDTDARTGTPTQAFIQYNIDREWFSEYWPDDRDDILRADCVEDPISNRSGLVDPVTVTMAWRPATYEGAEEAGAVGRYAIAVSNKTLLDTEYTHAEFPWAMWRWNTSVIGWTGAGAAEELAPIQIEINYIAQKIQKLMTLATSIVWVKKGSGVAPVNNKDWAMREYRDAPPIFQNVSSVSSEYFAHLDRLYARAYELVGISQLSATAVKPLGIDSGEGLRTYHDISQRRFLHTGQRWAQHTLDISELLLDCARKMKEEGNDVTVIYPGHRDAQEISSKEAVLEKRRYTVRLQPASLLPDDPAGKIEMLGRLAQAYPQLAPHLISLMASVPDLEYAVRLIRGPFELAEKHVDLILEKGQVESPHPLMDLGVARVVAQRSLLAAEIDGISDDRTELLRRYIGQIDALQQIQAPPTPPMPPPIPPQGMQSKPIPPPGALAPPPQS